MGAVMSLSIQPGTIALTWILCGASSIARDLVSWISAPLLAAYDGAIGLPKREYSLAMLIILPDFRAAIGRAASCDRKKHELRLVSSTRSQSSAASRSAPPGIAIP